ncbi:MAG TPA: hypothetical protein VLX68_10545 [Chitinivibrionales bacterium]|nr:hypothetical protein [Chitinivibrionales bacterium]
MTSKKDEPASRIMTWEEWQARRPELRKIARKICPGGLRRKESSSDKRLRAAFEGKRAPS